MMCEIFDCEVEPIAVGPDFVKCPECGNIYDEETLTWYRQQIAPRASSIPALDNGKMNPEWYIMEDGKIVAVGDRVFNYYDGEWVTITGDADPYWGWFDVVDDNGRRGRRNTLNSVRLSADMPAWMKKSRSA